MKTALGKVLMPMAQSYLRQTTTPFLKQWVWDNFHWREHSYTTRTRFGATMRGRSTDIVQGYIYYFGVWEPNLTHFIRGRLAGLGQRSFIDVGANVGYFTLLAAGSLPHGKVVSIEAFPSIYDHLVENVRLNDFRHVRTIHNAVTAKPESIEMFHGGSENEGATTSVKGVYQSEAIVVEGQPLGALLSDEEIAGARLIKIDVEGAEYHVVKGMAPLLARLPQDAEVVVEVTPSAASEVEIAEIFSIFEKEGFFPYALSNSYDPDYYLFSQKIDQPVRLEAMPDHQIDVIFSRVDAKRL